MSNLEETQPSYPRLPLPEDERWQIAIVRPKTQKHAELRTLPRPKLSEALLTVYAGDTVFTVNTIRYGSWVAAKVGYKVGWMDTTLVELALTRVPAEPHPGDGHDDDPAMPDEILMQMRAMGLSPEDKGEITLTAKDVTRIIRYLKGIAGTLRKARDRSSNVP
jgi:hypothetical protein